MATFEVAHIHEQGGDIIIVVVSPSVGSYGLHTQNRLRASLQTAATSAGLAGQVVLAWDAGDRRLGFLAPSQWHSYFQSLTLEDIAANINRTLTVSG